MWAMSVSKFDCGEDQLCDMNDSSEWSGRITSQHSCVKQKGKLHGYWPGLDTISRLTCGTHTIFPNQIAPVFSVPLWPSQSQRKQSLSQRLSRGSEAQRALHLHFLLGKGVLWLQRHFRKLGLRETRSLGKDWEIGPVVELMVSFLRVWGREQRRRKSIVLNGSTGRSSCSRSLASWRWAKRWERSSGSWLWASPLEANK